MEHNGKQYEWVNIWFSIYKNMATPEEFIEKGFLIEKK